MSELTSNSPADGIGRLLLATGNRGKADELGRLLHGLPIELLTLDDIGRVEEVEETGQTFEENAALKAAGYARQARLWTLADDSGLEIWALDGAPGVYSARFGGSPNYSDKIAALLRLMSAASSPDRSARFICAMKVADPSGRIRFSADGICRGSIADQPSGTNGFGYDPIFIPDGYLETFGELSDDVKSQISHRALAAVQIVRFLQDFKGN